MSVVKINYLHDIRIYNIKNKQAKLSDIQRSRACHNAASLFALSFNNKDKEKTNHASIYIRTRLSKLCGF